MYLKESSHIVIKVPLTFLTDINLDFTARVELVWKAETSFVI